MEWSDPLELRLEIYNESYYDRAKKVCEFYGLTINVAFNAYLVQIIRKKGLEYNPRIPIDLDANLNYRLRQEKVTLYASVVMRIVQNNLSMNEYFNYFLSKVVMEGVTLKIGGEIIS